MKKRQILIVLMLWLATALSAYSQSDLDTICLNTNTAKKLLFYKMEYFRLDTLARGQQYSLMKLDSANARKSTMLDLCNQQKQQQQQQFAKQLQQCRLEIKKLKVTQPKKPTVWGDIKKYALGALIGIVVYRVATD